MHFGKSEKALKIRIFNIFQKKFQEVFKSTMGRNYVNMGKFGGGQNRGLPDSYRQWLVDFRKFS